MRLRNIKAVGRQVEMDDRKSSFRQVTIRPIVICPFCCFRALPQWAGAGIWKCRSCALMFRFPLPQSRDLKAQYEESWLHPELSSDDTGAMPSEMAGCYLTNLVKTLGIASLEGLKLVDFGAGKGVMTQAMVDAGADVTAVEPFGTEYLTKLGVRAVRTTDELETRGTFDGVVTTEVLEHLCAPWEDLRKLHQILKPEGWLFMTVPNAAGLNARLLRSRWREALKKSHLMFLVPETLEHLLLACGFSRIQRLRGFVSHRKNASRRLIGYALQTVRLDGGLRYVAWKS